MPLTSEEFVRIASMGNIGEFEELIQRLFEPTIKYQTRNTVIDARTRIAMGPSTFNPESDTTITLMESFATLTLQREKVKNKRNRFLKVRSSKRKQEQRINACKGALHK
jgi:hypothetical protein